MARIEVLERWFFPSKLRDNGVVQPAPEEAVKKYQDLKSEWLQNHPKLPYEIPGISISPSKDPEKEGYFVKTEIMYK